MYLISLHKVWFQHEKWQTVPLSASLLCELAEGHSLLARRRMAESNKSVQPGTKQEDLEVARAATLQP